MVVAVDVEGRGVIGFTPVVVIELGGAEQGGVLEVFRRAVATDVDVDIVAVGVDQGVVVVERLVPDQLDFHRCIPNIVTIKTQDRSIHPVCLGIGDGRVVSDSKAVFGAVGLDIVERFCATTKRCGESATHVCDHNIVHRQS
ncbi:hypothetical protein CA13_06780 [Planctomycetes bacterium CA13]|uniref:Uncharacterized protein n=1 Tax=Novipirellula herctigrandis TaxID=2527986 RepID=A0A5C5YWN3_9BACT|nr:hypothetical protein CA13_06780 [Planctomycetes bacterium CA13]